MKKSFISMILYFAFYQSYQKRKTHFRKKVKLEFLPPHQINQQPFQKLIKVRIAALDFMPVIMRKMPAAMLHLELLLIMLTIFILLQLLATAHPLYQMIM